MDDAELKILENADEWDFEQPERRPGVKSPPAVVSVAFSRDDFARVSESAERLKKRTSEFIREAAMEKVARYQQQVAVAAFTASASATLFTRTHPPTTRLSGSARQLEETAVTT